MFVTEKMDQISGLPKIILHDILSKLPTKDAARTSILSKTWRETWLTFPILSFCNTVIMGRPPTEEEFFCKRDIFVDYVKKALQRFCDRGLAIKKVKLSVNCFDLEYMSQHVDLWLKLACESGVKIIEVYLPDAYGLGQWYIFPSSVLEAKSLNKLVLMGGIKMHLDSLNHSNKFFSLRELSLWSILLQDEAALDRFISLCPLIAHITLKCCYVCYPPSIGDLQLSWTAPLKLLSMCGLEKLKGVDVQGIQEVYIDAPNLESLCYIPHSRDVPYKLDFDSCRNLRLLHLWSWNSTVISNQWFLEMFSNYPFLETLKFENCAISESINISSAQLKVLEFSNCCNLKEVNIDAPNLISCGLYGGAISRFLSFLSCSSQLEVNVALSMDYKELFDLREFIQNLKPRKVLASLSLFIFDQYADEPHPYVLQTLSPLPHIKHLDLRTVPKDEAFYLPLLNCLFSICCPETISLFLHRQFCSKSFAEFLYETLVGKKQGECHCSSGNECWWHGLKNVKVTNELNTDENVDFKTMLDALPAAGENLCFSLEL